MLSSRALLVMVKSMVPVFRARWEGEVKAQYVLNRMLESEKEGVAAAELSAAKVRGGTVRRRDGKRMVIDGQ
jgi:hypothetical protein